MRYEKNQRETFKIIISILALGIVIIGLIITNAKKNNNSKPIVSEDFLEGIFSYNENVKYEFKKNGSGAMYDGNNKYEYTYTITGKNITMDFKNELVTDATYRYIVENDTLTLFGGDGTTGGKYILKKENK